MPLCRTIPQLLIWLLESDHRRSIDRSRASVFPSDALAERRHAGRDHISQLPGGFRQTPFSIFLCTPCVEHVNCCDGGLFVRIRGQRLQRRRHDIPVPRLVRSQVRQRLLVDTDDHDIGRGHPRLLEQRVLRQAVYAPQVFRPCQNSDNCRRDQRIYEYMSCLPLNMACCLPLNMASPFHNARSPGCGVTDSTMNAFLLISVVPFKSATPLRKEKDSS